MTYLHIGEVHLEHIRAWVAGVEKHELGLLQMIRRETLLDLNIAAIKDINDCWEGNNFSWIKQIRLVISQIQYVHANIWCQDWHHHLDDFPPKCTVARREGRRRHTKSETICLQLASSVSGVRGVMLNKTLASTAADAFT